MSESDNVKVVQSIYAAFGRGDLPTILDTLADDVIWHFNVHEAEVSWHKDRRGRAEVPAFFAAVGENCAFSEFSVKRILASRDAVAAQIHVAYHVKGTDKPVKADEIHLWTFGEGGKITRLDHFADSAQVNAAAKG